MRRLVKYSLVFLAIAAPAAAVTLGIVTQRSNGLAPDSLRKELSSQIVSKWQPYVERTQGAAQSGWSQRIQPVLKTTDIANLERAVSAGTFHEMSDSLFGGRRNIDARISPAQVQARTQGRSIKAAMVTPKAFGSPGTDLVFTPITPCRIVDTRKVGGAFSANGTRSYKTYTATDFASQGGEVTNCGIPINVSAISVTIASQAATGSGYFTAFPFGEAQPLAASLNYNVSTPSINVYSTQSNVRVCRPACASDFTVFSKAPTQLIMDVTGYYSEPEATAIECVVASETGLLGLLSGLQPKTVMCPAGYTATSGHCGGPVLGLSVGNSQPIVLGGQPQGHECDFIGSLLGAIAYEASATCCRLPGR